MLNRSVLWLSIVLLILVGLTLKWQRYGVVEPDKKQFASINGTEITDFMQRAGYIALGQQEITKDGNYQISVFKAPVCEGRIYLMPVSSTIDAQFMLQLARQNKQKVGFIYLGNFYQEFPKWQVMFYGPLQRLRSLVGLSTQRTFFKPAIASVEFGNCNMRQQVPWQKLWFSVQQ